jgi:hypothetical protein
MVSQPLTQHETLGLSGFVRLSGDPQTVTDTLGPLSNLVGTWIGNHGWNMIAVPSGSNGFTLLVRPYFEMITFTPLGALVPNRGGVETMFVAGLQYELRVADSETNQPLHLENGMWLLLNNGQDPSTPSIARQAAVPHGDSLLALGGFSVIDGPPQIPDLDAIPDTGSQPRLGYLDPYLVPMQGFNKTNPNQVLQDAIKEQTIVETVTLDVSTQNNGGIVNIPFIVKHANATAFQCTFWIETVKNQETGSEFQQLQYSQQTNIDFLPKFGDPSQLIMWPHVNVNTLVKQ